MNKNISGKAFFVPPLSFAYQTRNIAPFSPSSGKFSPWKLYNIKYNFCLVLVKIQPIKRLKCRRVVMVINLVSAVYCLGSLGSVIYITKKENKY